MPDYRRFIVLTFGRTGSTWLVEAPNSHPRITCFGSVFEAGADFVSFDVDGYNNFSAKDRDLRDQDFAAFLRDRIFCQHSPDLGAAGFKLQYRNVFGFKGLLQHLTGDPDLGIVHLKRRNLLRPLISLRLAKTTGQYHQRPIRVGWGSLATAARHPTRAIGRLRARFATRRYAPPALTLTKKECGQFFLEVRKSEAHYDQLFSEHERVDVVYEDMVEDLQAVLAGVQEFLGVPRRTLTHTHRPMNPSPTRELLANHDKLRKGFEGSPYHEFFA